MVEDARLLLAERCPEPGCPVLLALLALLRPRAGVVALLGLALKLLLQLGAPVRERVGEDLDVLRTSAQRCTRSTRTIMVMERSGRSVER